MKIVVLTVDQIYANALVKDLLSSFGNDIKLIVEPKSQLKGKTTFQMILKYLKTCGLYYTISQSIKLGIFKLLSKIFFFPGRGDNKFYSYKKFADKLKVRHLTVEDVNSSAFLDKLRRIKPDLIVSVLFSHILKEEIIKLPKKGVINIHPAHLPDYKGISPVFWSLVNGEKHSGVSVHFIDKGIDTGGIIARKKVKIEESDTEDSLYWKCIRTGSDFLIESIKNALRGKVKTVSNKRGSYYSFPIKEAVKKFRARGKSFFRLDEYLGLKLNMKFLSFFLIVAVTLMAIGRTFNFYYFGDAFTNAYHGVLQICPYTWPFKTVCPPINLLYRTLGSDPRIFFTLSIITRILLGFIFYLFLKRRVSGITALLLSLAAVSVGGEDVVLGYYAILENAAIGLILLAVIFLSQTRKILLFLILALLTYFVSLEYFPVFSTGHIFIFISYVVFLVGGRVNWKIKSLLILTAMAITFRAYVYLPYMETGRDFATGRLVAPDQVLKPKFLIQKAKQFFATSSFFVAYEGFQGILPKYTRFIFQENSRVWLGAFINLLFIAFTLKNIKNKKVFWFSVFSYGWLVSQFVVKSLVSPSYIGRDDRHFYYTYMGFLMLVAAFSMKREKLFSFLLIIMIVLNCIFTGRYLGALSGLHFQKRYFFEKLKTYMTTIPKGSVIYIDGSQVKENYGLGEIVRVGHYPSEASIGYVLKTDIENFRLVTNSQVLTSFLAEGRIDREKLFGFYYEPGNLVDTTQSLRDLLFLSNKDLTDFKVFDPNVMHFQFPDFVPIVPSKIKISLSAEVTDFPIPFLIDRFSAELSDFKAFRYYDFLSASRKLKKTVSISEKNSLGGERKYMIDEDASTFWRFDRYKWYFEEERPEILFRFSKAADLSGLILTQDSPHKPTDFEVFLDGKKSDFSVDQGESGFVRITFPVSRLREIKLVIRNTVSDAPRIQEIEFVAPEFPDINLSYLNSSMNSKYKNIRSLKDKESYVDYLRGGAGVCLKWKGRETGATEQVGIAVIPDGKVREYVVGLPTFGLEPPVFEMGCLDGSIRVNLNTGQIVTFR